jgi:hypothetical protein
VHPVHPLPPHWAYFATEHPPLPPPLEVVVAAAEVREVVAVAEVRRVVLDGLEGTEVASPPEPGV